MDRRLMGGDSGGERTCDLVGRDAWIGVGPARTSLAGHGRERFDGSGGIVDAAHPLHLRQPGLDAPLAPALGVHAADDHRPRARHRVGAKLRCGVVVLVHSGDIGRHYFGRDIRVGIDVSHGSVGLSASGWRATRGSLCVRRGSSDVRFFRSIREKRRRIAPRDVAIEGTSRERIARNVRSAARGGSACRRDHPTATLPRGAMAPRRHGHRRRGVPRRRRPRRGVRPGGPARAFRFRPPRAPSGGQVRRTDGGFGIPRSQRVHRRGGDVRDRRPGRDLRHPMRGGRRGGAVQERTSRSAMGIRRDERVRPTPGGTSKA